MWELLTSPIDPSRVHEVGFAVSWHGRLMFIGWGVLAPLAIIIARFFKVLPGQDWPRELDSLVWWRSHWVGQTVVCGLTVVGYLLVLPADVGAVGLHGWIGYAVLAGALLQVLFGVFRGSKGGPTDRTLRGHHYDMTPWRLAFEAVHKTVGYTTLGLAAVAILLGFWKANAPVWMWLFVAVWWPAVVAIFCALQRRGMAVDTYQAIWGDDPAHPGNRRPNPGWGVRRPGQLKGETHVRSDRGHGVRSSRPQL